jgi:tetratricopeptide (TPR) repeat protein
VKRFLKVVFLVAVAGAVVGFLAYRWRRRAPGPLWESGQSWQTPTVETPPAGPSTAPAETAEEVAPAAPEAPPAEPPVAPEPEEVSEVEAPVSDVEAPAQEAEPEAAAEHETRWAWTPADLEPEAAEAAMPPAAEASSTWTASPLVPPGPGAESPSELVEEFERLAATSGERTEAVALGGVIEEALHDVAPQPVSTAGRDAESYLDEGNVYFNVGQWALAIDRYSRALELDANLTAGYYNRANARTRSGEYDQALADYDQALRLQPNDTDALNNRGMLHLYRANYDAALQDFNAALAGDPSDTTVMVNRGLAYLHGGDPAAALVDFQEAAALDSNDAAAHYGAAQAAAVLGNRDEAMRRLRRTLQIDAAYAREAAADPKLTALQGDNEFMKLLRDTGSRARE